MIGDSNNDIEAGVNAGLKQSFLIDSEHSILGIWNKINS